MPAQLAGGIALQTQFVRVEGMRKNSVLRRPPYAERAHAGRCDRARESLGKAVEFSAWPPVAQPLQNPA